MGSVGTLECRKDVMNSYVDPNAGSSRQKK